MLHGPWAVPPGPGRRYRDRRRCCVSTATVLWSPDSVCEPGRCDMGRGRCCTAPRRCSLGSGWCCMDPAHVRWLCGPWVLPQAPAPCHRTSHGAAGARGRGCEVLGAVVGPWVLPMAMAGVIGHRRCHGVLVVSPAVSPAASRGGGPSPGSPGRGSWALGPPEGRGGTQGGPPKPSPRCRCPPSTRTSSPRS